MLKICLKTEDTLKIRRSKDCLEIIIWMFVTGSWHESEEDIELM